MADEQLVVVVYDISNNRRRTKLHKRLKDFGTPVQYSVFECYLKVEELERVKQIVEKIIRPRVDHVRYYVICGACRAKIEITGRREVTSKPEVIVV